MSLITPHGAASLTPLIATGQRLADLERESAMLPSITLSSAAAANAVMLGAGYFTPLQGFMNKSDTLAVAEHMKTESSIFWPVPVVNLTPDGNGISPGARIALRDPNVAGHPVIAIQDVEAVEALSEEDVDFIAQQVYRTKDEAHPGVATFASLGRVLVCPARSKC